MTDFSIEMMAEKIIDPKTKKYFQEVYRSYAVGNYRAAVVCLWTVIVCDLIFKLRELADLGDKTAFSILEKIKDLQEKNPTSPEWEKILLEEIKKRTQFLENFEYEFLLYLQKRRHICAHPVLTQEEILFTPSKDEVRSLIRNALEYVLTKPAIMTKKVFDALVEELEAKKDILLNKETLERFLSTKYFPHFNDLIENRIFESLWMLVFKVTDERCEKNRDINFLTLTILYERRPEAIQNYIKDKRDKFSEISLEQSIPKYFFAFLREHPYIFNLLNDAAKAQIESLINSNIDYFIQAYFLSRSLEEHLDKVLRKFNEIESLDIKPSTYKWLFNFTKGLKPNLLNKVLEIGIVLYGKSENFNIADERFSNFIAPYLEYYNDKSLFIKLLKAINNNSQTYLRRRASLDHNLIVKKIREVLNIKIPKEDPELGKNIFPNFWMFI